MPSEPMQVQINGRDVLVIEITARVTDTIIDQIAVHISAALSGGKPFVFLPSGMRVAAVLHQDGTAELRGGGKCDQP